MPVKSVCAVRWNRVWNFCPPRYGSTAVIPPQSESQIDFGGGGQSRDSMGLTDLQANAEKIVYESLIANDVDRRGSRNIAGASAVIDVVSNFA